MPRGSDHWASHHENGNRSQDHRVQAKLPEFVCRYVRLFNHQIDCLPIDSIVLLRAEFLSIIQEYILYYYGSPLRGYSVVIYNDRKYMITN